jgi:hypothetical protein
MAVAERRNPLTDELTDDAKTEWTWSWPARLTADGKPGYGLICRSREEAAAEAEPYMTIVSREPGDNDWTPA